MQLKEKIAVMQAFADGKKIEIAHSNRSAAVWHASINPGWDWACYTYRIKVEPRKVFGREEIGSNELTDATLEEAVIDYVINTKGGKKITFIEVLEN